ncbi:PepSY-associated TM helix domain-containing protein [Polyangium mundeleinium]|uniref:PepSY-associated TM helix domain-containing protein n=1 Tax=Polyangium mundeleinium TaxID=2995306 RepID=A0ABT5EGW8_9BACT|nr:PepSY-associated TM helix domain-containing protein [Polyangium mundeleinium]MDC0741068.1 PepSY-associated TM helix domain-containing protein [Polyangium mundeleinium]
MAEGAPEPRRRLSLRGLLRTVHRDAGNLAVGLTLVYAASGLAVNHIADWDPNFKSHQTTHDLGGPLEGEDQAVAERVLQKLDVKGKASDVYRAAPNQLEITLDRRTLHVDTQTGKVLDEGEEPRFFLRLANWLHLNRGKKAWTYVADGYAVLLLLLAFSGMFMLPGRKGLIGRGGIFVLVGAAVPIAYVVLSGGP